MKKVIGLLLSVMFLAASVANAQPRTHYYGSSRSSWTIGLGEPNELVIANSSGNMDIGAASLTTTGSMIFDDLTATGDCLLGNAAGDTHAIKGTTSINPSINANVNICTGTSTGLVTIGGGSGTLAISTTGLDVTAAGAVSGVTDLTATGDCALGDAAGDTNAIKGTTSINASVNANVNIATGTSTGLVTVGGGSGTMAINTTTWTVAANGTPNFLDNSLPGADITDDSLDFTEFSDTMALDAATSITGTAAEVLTINRTLTNATDESGLVINVTASDTTSGTVAQYGLALGNVASTEGLDSILWVGNADTDDACTNGIQIYSAAGTITNALNIGADVTNFANLNGTTISMAEAQVLDNGIAGSEMVNDTIDFSQIADSMTLDASLTVGGGAATGYGYAITPGTGADDTAAGDFQISAATGGASSAGPGGEGSDVTINTGNGGAGGAAQTAGDGGDFSSTLGSAGADGGGGGNNGGNYSFTAGNGTAAGTGGGFTFLAGNSAGALGTAGGYKFDPGSATGGTAGTASFGSVNPFGSVTIITDGSGDGEVVLPTGSIGSGEILDITRSVQVPITSVLSVASVLSLDASAVDTEPDYVDLGTGTIVLAWDDTAGSIDAGYVMFSLVVPSDYISGGSFVVTASQDAATGGQTESIDLETVCQATGAAANVTWSINAASNLTNTTNVQTLSFDRSATTNIAAGKVLTVKLAQGNASANDTVYVHSVVFSYTAAQ